MSKTIGIVGGMGPMAAADLLVKIISKTDAACDQQHAHVILDNNTNIPDRTAAILSGGEDPLPELVRSCLRLEGAGADLLVIACNTAHYFYDSIIPFVDIPVLHMPRETAEAAARCGYKKCALLATDGTVRAGIYDEAFSKSGVGLIKPDADGQQAVMDMIYKGVKAGKTSYDTSKVEQAVSRLRDEGAECFILGCTEMPIAFARYGISAKTLDPTDVLASAALREAGLTEIQPSGQI